MPFPKKLLNDGEEVVLDLRPHWAAIFWPTLIPVLLIAAVVVELATLGTDSGAGQAVAVVLLVALVAAAVNLVVRYLKWTNTNFVVTSDRLIYRTGVLSKQGKEIPLDRINDISFAQTVFERMIGAGDLTIESAGTSGQQPFHNVRKPSVVQNTIYRMVESEQNRHADRAAGSWRAREASLPDQLERLDELRRQGVLSQAEFDVEKAQLLERF